MRCEAIALTLSLTVLASPLAAAPIELQRGFSTDIWITWPDDAGLADPMRLTRFPEWRSTVPAGSFTALRAAGFDFVRLTIDPAVFLIRPDAERTRVLLEGTAAAIDGLLAQGLKVVVDLHATPRDDASPVGTGALLATEPAFARLETLVGEVARLVARYPVDQVALELLNEPVIDCDWESRPRVAPWPELQKRLHATARAAAPATTIVLTAACWGGLDALAQFDPTPFDDPDTLWSFHYYDPMLVTHQGATWTGETVKAFHDMRWPASRLDVWDLYRIQARAIGALTAGIDDATERERRIVDALYHVDRWRFHVPDAAAIARDIARAGAWADRHGIARRRILLGEFGAMRQKDGGVPPEDRLAWLAAVREAAESSGFAWAVWGHGGFFAITRDDAARSPDPDVMAALGLRS